MKNVVTRWMVAGIALAGVALYAQERTVVANVPFSFYMGSKAMPQGAYRVDQIGNGNAVSMRSAHVINSVAARGIVGKSENEKPRLIFKCYGDDCFLSQIWTGDASRGLELTRSARERELASNGPSATLAVVSVALH